MKKKLLAFLFAGLSGIALSLSAVSCGRSSEFAEVVIPRPATIEKCAGTFRIPTPLTVAFDTPETVADALGAYLRTTSLPAAETAEDAALRFVLTSEEGVPASEEGYELSVLPEGAVVRARGEAGLFYGLQTLLQLRSHYGDKIPAQRIVDAPRFGYRGMHLDESRHFFGKEFVKKQLRMMASLKLNRLHWHLTDGGGGAIGIDRYSELTGGAAWRAV